MGGDSGGGRSNENKSVVVRY